MVAGTFPEGVTAFITEHGHLSRLTGDSGDSTRATRQTLLVALPLPAWFDHRKRQTKCMVGIFAAQAAGVRSAMCRSGTLASPGRISAR